MKLQVPIKQAKFFGWQHILKDLGDFKKCISQGFGENGAWYQENGIMIIGHNGIDIPYEDGTEVYASHDGKAHYSEDSRKGLGVTVTGDGLKTISWHFKNAVKPLNSTWEVKTGDLLGWGDNTGFSTSSHLHFGLKLLDNNGNVLNRDNGYDGAIDPIPYIVWFDMKFELRQATGSSEVWLIRNGKKTHVYNANALLLVADFADIKSITQAELDAIPDSGLELASLVKE